jgi:hypothetical protein
MPKIYHRPERKIPAVNLTLTQCGKGCPNYKEHDGQGHCNDWVTCEALQKEIWNYSTKIINGFPSTCPLSEA